jgi:hypothetical protein
MRQKNIGASGFIEQIGVHLWWITLHEWCIKSDGSSIQNAPSMHPDAKLVHRCTICSYLHLPHHCDR